MTITRRDAVDLGLNAISLVALLARAVALALSDIEDGLRDLCAGTPSVIPEWLQEDVDLP